jgi:hypothetical protein
VVDLTKCKALIFNWPVEGMCDTRGVEQAFKDAGLGHIKLIFVCGFTDIIPVYGDLEPDIAQLVKRDDNS